MEVRFLDTQKTNLRWLLIGYRFYSDWCRHRWQNKAFMKRLNVKSFLKYNLPSTPNHTKNNLVSSSQFYAFYGVCLSVAGRDSRVEVAGAGAGAGAGKCRG